MKRSELLIEISDMLNRSENLDSFSPKFKDSELSEEILSLVEKLGMKPPLPDWGNHANIRDYVWEDLQD